MELTTAFQVTAVEEERPGAFVTFPYDRELVRRFRETFPRARWREADEGWFVPGTRAAERLDAWIAAETAHLDRHADAKGRDAFLFDPLSSDYLVPGEDLEVRTPYSRTVVEEMRAIPFARWDPAARLWRVPFRSYERLRQRWPVIEAAARRNEPEAKRQRRAEHHPPDEQTLVLMAERRRRRYPVPADAIPPLGEPVAVFHFGVVVFEVVDLEPVDDVSTLAALGVYPHLREEPDQYRWAHWRLPSREEALFTRPAKQPADWGRKVLNGWWPPSREEKRERLRKLREIERARHTRTEKAASTREAAE